MDNEYNPIETQILSGQLSINLRVSKLLGRDPIVEGSWADQKTEFSAFNDAGLECEVGEFMYSMVRLLKPDGVLETGTHHGVGAAYIGLALNDNRNGVLDTFEFLPPIHQIAKTNLNLLTEAGRVNLHLGDVGEFTPAGRYNMILLDTEPQTRFNEMVKFWDYLYSGGYLFIHDLHRHMGQVGQNPDHPNEPFWPWGKVPKFINDKVKSGEARPFHFNNPRGLTGFYKVSPDDFKFGIESEAK